MVSNKWRSKKENDLINQKKLNEMATFISKNSTGLYDADNARYPGDLNLTAFVQKEVNRVKAQVTKLKNEISAPEEKKKDNKK